MLPFFFLFTTRRKHYCRYSPEQLSKGSRLCFVLERVLKFQNLGFFPVWMKTEYFSTPCKRPVQHWLSCTSWTQLWSWTANSWGAADWKAKIPVPHGHPARQPGAGAISPAAFQMCGRGWGSWGAALSAGQGTEVLGWAAARARQNFQTTAVLH